MSSKTSAAYERTRSRFNGNATALVDDMKETGFPAFAAFDQKPIMNQKDNDQNVGLCVGLATMFIIYEVGVTLILHQADGNHGLDVKKLPEFIKNMIQNYHDSQMLSSNFFKALECKFDEDMQSRKQLEFRGFKHFCNATDCYDDLGEYLTTPIESPPAVEVRPGMWSRKIEKTYFLINIPGHTMAAYYVNGILLFFDPNIGILGINRREEAGHFLRCYFQSPYQFPAYKESDWTRNGPPYMSRPTFLVLRFFPREANSDSDGNLSTSHANDGRELGSIPLEYRLFMNKLCDSRRSCCRGMWTGTVFGRKVFVKEGNGRDQDLTNLEEFISIDPDDGSWEARHPREVELSKLSDEARSRRGESQSLCVDLFYQSFPKGD